MLHYKRLIAFVIAAVLVLSLAGCGGSGGAAAQKQPNGNVQLQRPLPNPGITATQPATPATEPVTGIPEPGAVTLSPINTPTPQPDRDSLEEVAQLVTGGEQDFEELTDEELTDLIEDQLRQEESAATPADPDELPVSTEPAVDTDPEGYDENGAMTLPFDQLYPELVENEQVAYDAESVLL